MHLSVKRNRTKNKINYSYPVLVVNRSNKNLSLNLLEPITKRTITIFTTSTKSGSKANKSLELSKEVAKLLEEKSYKKVVFDRNGYLYHGRIRQLVDNIRSFNIEI